MAGRPHAPDQPPPPDACAAPGPSASGRHQQGSGAFHERIFEYRSVETRKLAWVMAITTITMLVEVGGGILTGSLALISDAGHMFTHSFAILISLLAIVIARNPPCHHRTYGLFRAEILAAFVNGLFLMGVTAWIVWESVRRLAAPVPVRGPMMLVVALFGLAVNLGTMLILRGHHRRDLNVRGVFLHLLADTLSSVAIVIGAAVIGWTGFTAVDPIISLGISAAIAAWSWGLLREASRILLEMAPRGLDVHSVTAELRERFPDIESITNVHFWAITSEMYVFTAHVRLREGARDPDAAGRLVGRITGYLKARHPIVESTIQWVP